MVGLQAGLSIIVGAAVLAGIALEISWKIGLPASIALCAVTFWCTACVREDQRARVSMPDKALVYFTILLSLCCVASVLGSAFLPIIATTLNVVILASTPAHFFLFEKQWHKMSQRLHFVAGASGFLTFVGLISTGLCFNIGWVASIPCAVLLVYSSIVLGCALFENEMMKTNAMGITCLVVVMISTLSSFIAYSLAPLWCPVAVLTTFCSATFLTVAECHATGLYAKYGSFSALLQLVAAAAAGLAITTEMPPAWIIISLLAMVPGTGIIGFRLYRIHKEEILIGRSAHIYKCRRVLTAVLIFMLSLMTILTIAFYYAFESLSLWIPLIFIGIVALRSIVVYHVIFDCREHYKYIGAAAAFLSLASLYLFFVVLMMAQPTPLLSATTLWEHLIALSISATLAFHCVLTFWCEWSNSIDFAQPAGSVSPMDNEAIGSGNQRDDDSDYNYEEIGVDNDNQRLFV